LRAFNSKGLTIRAAFSHVKQYGIFSVGDGSPTFPQDDSAWIADAAIEYLLPRRRGQLLVGANNVFDEELELFDTDPVNPRIATGRFVYGRLRLLF
jgi:hypothetical protein